MVETEAFYVLQAVRRIDEQQLDTRTVRELSEAEYTATSSAIQSIQHLLSGFDEYIHRAIADLRRSCKEAGDQYSDNPVGLDSARVAKELEYRVINVCASVKMYAEHVSIALSQIYGKASPERHRVLEQFSALYDASRAYRVCNHLRNALVHGSPSELLTTKFHGKLSDSGAFESTVEVLLSRDGFRRRAENAKVRDEVAELPFELELISLSSEAARQALELHEEIVNLLHPDIVSAIRILAPQFEEAACDEHEWVGWMEVRPSARDGARLIPLPLPDEVGKLVDRYLKLPAYLQRAVPQSRTGRAEDAERRKNEKE